MPGGILKIGDANDPIDQLVFSNQPIKRSISFDRHFWTEDIAKAQWLHDFLCTEGLNT